MIIKGKQLTINKVPLAITIAVLILCAGPAFVVNGLFGYYPVIFLLSLCALSFIYIWVLAGNIKLTGNESSHQCMRKEDLVLEQYFQNTGFLPLASCEAVFISTDLDGAPRSESRAEFSLGPKEERTLHFRVSFDHVGEYRFYLKELQISGLLGVISVVIPGKEQIWLEVLPAVHNMSSVDFSGVVQAEHENARFRSSADSIDFSGVRDYVAGDPIKLIHWNLSSHSGNYVTKTMESYGNHSLTVISGFAEISDPEKKMDRFDIVTECCASLNQLAGEEGMEVYFFIEDQYGDSLRVTSKEGTVPPELLKSNGSDRRFLNRLAEEAGNRYASDHTAVCTSYLDPEVTDYLVMMARAGRHVMLFLAVDSTDDIPKETEAAIRTMSYFGISCWTIRSADEIDRVVG